MLASFPKTVNTESFSSAWTWAERRLRRAKRASLIGRVSLPAAQPFFFAAMMLLLYSLLYDCGGPLVMAYLKQAPQILDWWKQLRLHLFPNGETGLDQAKVWAVLLWAVPFCAAGIAAAPVALLYHPRRRALDSGDSPAEQARQLCLLLREAKAKTQRRDSDLAGFCFLFFAMFWAALLLGFILFCQKNPATRAAVDAMAHTTNLLLFVSFVILILCYRLIYLPLGFMLRLLRLCPVPNAALEGAEGWFSHCADLEAEAASKEGEG